MAHPQSESEEPRKITNPIEQNESESPSTEIWTSGGITDYRTALEEALEFPLRADKIVPLFVVGILFNFISVADDGSQGAGLLLAIPMLLFFGYLASVGAHVAQGGEKPPQFRLSVEDCKRYLRDGVKLLVPSVPLLLGGAVISAIIVVPFTFVFGEGIMDPAATVMTIPIFLGFLLTLPAVLVHAGFDDSIKGSFTGERRQALFDVLFTRAYVEALLAFVVLLTVARTAGTIAEFIPIIGTLIAAGLLFYAQLASLYIVGNVYTRVSKST